MLWKQRMTNFKRKLKGYDQCVVEETDDRDDRKKCVLNTVDLHKQVNSSRKKDLSICTLMQEKDIVGAKKVGLSRVVQYDLLTDMIVSLSTANRTQFSAKEPRDEI